MGIWKDMYGTRSDEFIEGVKAGIEMYAIWKDGQQLVGIQQTSLKKVLAEVEKDLGGKKND